MRPRYSGTLLALVSLAFAGGAHSALFASEPGDAIAASARAYAAGDAARARSVLRDALTAQPRWTGGLWALARIEYQEKQWEPARALARRLTAVDPKHGPGWVLLGLCDFALRDYGDALEHIRHGRRLGVPEALGLHDAARYQIILASVVTGHFEDALFRLEEFVEDPATRATRYTEDVRLAWGMAALRIPLLPRNARSALPPDALAVIRAVGEAQFAGAQRDSSAVHRIYSELLKRHPRERRLHFAYGSLLTFLRQWPEARRAFGTEIAIDPTSVHARLGLSYVALESGTPQHALEVAREAVRLAPDHHMAHYYLGRILMDGEDYSGAVAALTRSRDLQPESSRVRYALAQAMRSAGDLEGFAVEHAAFERLKAIEEAEK